jgi:hypothetical protein
MRGPFARRDARPITRAHAAACERGSHRRRDQRARTTDRRPEPRSRPPGSRAPGAVSAGHAAGRPGTLNEQQLPAQDAATPTADPWAWDGGSRRSPWPVRLFGVAVAAAVIPIVVAAARAIGRGWIPTGDNAQLALRSLDVFNQHLPLLGSWSSSSASYGINVNNPGPMMFDALAVPSKLLGVPIGIPVAVAALNVAAVAGIAWFAWRRGGPVLGIIAMTAASALAWAMGSELLYEPWQPHSLMLPFLLFLFVAWSALCGDLIALPFVAFVGSYLLQTHLTYAVLVPVLGAWALAGSFVSLRLARRRDPDGWPVLRRQARRALAIAGALLAIAWAQPVIEQFTSSPSGNLTRLIRASRAPHVKTVGMQLATRLVASVVSVPPLWFRSATQRTFNAAAGWRPPSGFLAAASLAAVVAVLVLCAWGARRRADRVALPALATSALLLLAAVVTAARTPITVFGAYNQHELRWLWPVAAFVSFTIVASLVRRLPVHHPSGAAVLGGFTLIAVVLAALNLPTATVGDTPNTMQYAIPAQKQLNASMRDLTARGPLLIDDLFKEEFALFDPYGWAVLAELQRRNIPFVAADAELVRQLGPRRQFTGHNARGALLERKGTAALTPPAGSRRVAFGEGLSPADLRELATLDRQITAELQRAGLQLNRRGEAARQRGEIAPFNAPGSAGVDAPQLLSSGELAALISQHDLVVDPAWAGRFVRYASLQQAWSQQTVALFLAPLSVVRTTRNPTFPTP